MGIILHLPEKLFSPILDNKPNLQKSERRNLIGSKHA